MCDGKEIKEQLKELKEAVKQNDRALRGSNGNAGLVADVRILREHVKSICDVELPALKEDVLDEISKLQVKAVLWPNLFRGILGPISVAVLTTILVAIVEAVFH